ESTCAFRVASVVAAAERPTGPAATDASAPSVTLPSAMPSTLLRDISTNTTSVDCTPHWNPTLTPASVMNTGSLHDPSRLRTAKSPLPPRAPMISAPLITRGTTTTPYARSINQVGIICSLMSPKLYNTL